MREVLRGILAIVIIAVILALVVPGLVLGLRLADTWTRNETQNLLGGALAICGGAAAIVAVMVGAGAFARLAGWRPPRREEPPIVLEAPPGWDERPPLGPPASPPWGVTGGGQYELLPPAQDRRFRLETEKEERSTTTR